MTLPLDRGGLAPFFAPRSVAVVGASRDPSKVGGSVLANLRAGGFEGRIWPVNPKSAVVQGLPAVPSVLAIDGPMADFGDQAALEAECRVSRQLGFSGKQCIHPSQIDPINRAFSPSAEEVAHARAVLAAYEDAAARGHGSTRVGERMVDAPILKRARQILDLDAAIQGARPPSPRDAAHPASPRKREGKDESPLPLGEG